MPLTVVEHVLVKPQGLRAEEIVLKSPIGAGSQSRDRRGAIVIRASRRSFTVAAHGQTSFFGAPLLDDCVKKLAAHFRDCVCEVWPSHLYLCFPTQLSCRSCEILQVMWAPLVPT